jgi:hypothetical protein
LKEAGGAADLWSYELVLARNLVSERDGICGQDKSASVSDPDHDPAASQANVIIDSVAESCGRR